MTENYYDGLPPISDFINRYELKALKSLGQNFILDLNLTDKIAKSVPNIQNSVVVEVGSGPAGLTRALLKNNAKKVIAIELDNRAIGILKELQQTYGDRLEIIESDALFVDFKMLKSKYASDCDFRICANLPYNVSIPLTAKWLFDADIINSMTLMFQLEVGERIVAKPKTKDYGRISIVSQLTNDVRILFKVPRTCFTPAPKVTSCIVQFEAKDTQPSTEILLKLTDVVKQAFSERRKMVRSTLKPLFDDSEKMLKVFDAVGILETARAEELSPETFLKLTEMV
ncbi:MAG: 16S rRNA (adenine(1518)-N(6)/adenine(1519)-N(6))-dimethyltransferase RsmA [Alphaproteobacteria bacterium]|nr:16S rRNA (adenine(1518)-N(6)/adenine(1519)-N(6))-dimethyltransferase RsmA [Alphaproteobacteria bacterium]